MAKIVLRRRALFTTVLLVELLDTPPDLAHVSGAFARVEAKTLLDEELVIARNIEALGPGDVFDRLDQGRELPARDCFFVLRLIALNRRLDQGGIGVKAAAFGVGEPLEARELTGEEFEGHHAEAVDIPPEPFTVCRVARIAELLGAGVERGADRLGSLGRLPAALSEIANLDVKRRLVSEEDVRRFDVAVDDLIAMQVGDGIGDSRG